MEEQMRYPGAAKFLGISVPTLKLWVYDGKIPYYKMGRFVLFERKDLENFVKNCRVEAA
jgi:excisionase family DNA binding protein